MSAYVPAAMIHLWATSAILAANLVVGFGITRVRSIRTGRSMAWIVLTISVAGVDLLNDGESTGFRMLAIILTLLYSMKTVVCVEARASGARPLNWWRWIGFAVLWPGMQPALFIQRTSRSRSGAESLLRLGFARLAAGAAMVFLARLAWIGTGSRLLATALLLPGLSQWVHLGVFNMMAAAWRLAEFDCRPLFVAPLRSKSLEEFWGRRWNRAFSRMTASAIYRPLVCRIGRRGALYASFLASGVLHELAISAPVKAGFGLPLGYFALHGALCLVERRWARAGRPIDRTPWIGRAWTLGWLVLPLPILFHRAFLAGVIWPLIGMPA
jgi:hypothetical protein